MFIKPGAGLRICDPISKLPLKDAGEEKPDSSYWVRRLRCGDVVECDPPTIQPAADVVNPTQIPDSAPVEGEK